MILIKFLQFIKDVHWTCYGLIYFESDVAIVSRINRTDIVILALELNDFITLESEEQTKSKE